MAVIVIEDKGQQEKKHGLKHLWFENHGIYWERYPLPCGDYILGTEKVINIISRKQKRGLEPKKMDFLGTYTATVDTKKDLQEIITNICGEQHDRFRDECILAQNNGIKLIVLIENDDGVKSIDDLDSWSNPRARVKKWITTPSGTLMKVLKYPRATHGITLAKAMRTMEEKYGVQFLFCTPDEAGKRVIELLTMEADYGEK